MESDYHGLRWTTWFLCKQGVKSPDIHRWLSVCGEKTPAHSTVFTGASTVAKKLHRRLSMSGITISVTSGSVVPSRSSRRDGSNV